MIIVRTTVVAFMVESSDQAGTIPRWCQVAISSSHLIFTARSIFSRHGTARHNPGTSCAMTRREGLVQRQGWYEHVTSGRAIVEIDESGPIRGVIT